MSKAAKSGLVHRTYCIDADSIRLVGSRYRVSAGEYFWKTTLWMDDLPHLYAEFISGNINC